MPEISVQHQCAMLTDLVACESFGAPIGDLPKQTDSGFFQEGNLTAGTWECEAGTLQLDLEITEFCQLNYGVSFPMFGKIEVNGGGADPLFKHLKSEAPGALDTESIKWNFTKFLIDTSGNVVKRYAPKTKPSEIAADIEALLA